jgi:hypothetical protein
LPDVPAAPAAPESDDGLGEALSSGWDKLSGEAEPAAPTSPSEPAAPAAEPSAPAPDAAATDTRARGPDGKFIPKPDAPTDPKAVVVDPTKPVAPPEFKVPASWPADVRAKLEAIHKVNPDHAQFLLEQHAYLRGQFENQRQKLAPIQKISESIESLLAPGRQARALKNIDDGTYVRNLVAAGEFLDKNPVDGLKWLAKNYGIDLQQLANPTEGGAPAISPEVQQLHERLSKAEQFLQQQRVQADQQQLRAASDWIEQFASQKDAAGNRLYPHFDEVLNELLVNVQYQRDSGQQIDVKAAYDRAVRMNDTVWQRVQGAQSEAARKAADEKRQRDIAEAKTAGFHASGSGAATRGSVPDDLGDHLAANYDRFVK